MSQGDTQDVRPFCHHLHAGLRSPVLRRVCAGTWIAVRPEDSGPCTTHPGPADGPPPREEDSPNKQSKTGRGKLSTMSESRSEGFSPPLTCFHVMEGGKVCIKHRLIKEGTND